MQSKRNFDDKFKALGEYYNIISPMEIRKQLEKNENIFILLEEVKPYLEKYFEEAKYSLRMNFEPEMDDKFIILGVYVSEERFNNGVVEDIKSIESEIWNIEKRYDVLREVLIMPEILDV